MVAEISRPDLYFFVQILITALNLVQNKLLSQQDPSYFSLAPATTKHKANS